MAKEVPVRIDRDVESLANAVGDEDARYVRRHRPGDAELAVVTAKAIGAEALSIGIAVDAGGRVGAGRAAVRPSGRAVRAHPAGATGEGRQDEDRARHM